jgi:GTP-binding protein HflX
MRKVELPDVGSVILSDTVGFISHLPHKLVEAFSATLEEAASATLLLHVIDSHSDNRQRNMDSVSTVLNEIGAGDNPQLQVYNKIDLLADSQARIDRDDSGKPVAVWLSASKGIGLDLLIEAIRELLSDDMVCETLHLPANLGRLRARLFAVNAVQQEEICDDGSLDVTIRMPLVEFNRLLKAEGLSSQQLMRAKSRQSRESA